MIVGKKAKPVLWGVERTAKELGLNESQIHALAASGALPYFPYGINGSKRFDPEDIEAYKAKVRAGRARLPGNRRPSWLEIEAAA